MSDVSRRRRPDWVYDGGEEPDARFSLANERTFLAWMRTTIALLGVAAALDVVPLPLPPSVQSLMAAALGLLGALTAVQGWVGWARTERALRRSEPMPGNPMSALLMVVLTLAALVVVVSAVGEFH